MIDRVYREDYQDRFLYGEPGRYNNEPKAGRVGVAKFQGSYFEYQCGVIAEQGDAMLGASISYQSLIRSNGYGPVLPDINMTKLITPKRAKYRCFFIQAVRLQKTPRMIVQYLP